MKHYIEELKRQLHEIMERPVTLGRAEEVTVYADAKAWTAKMENEDGTTGPHWTMGQTDAVANVAGVHVDKLTFWACLNMMYSDYYSVAAKYGLDRPEFYADLAKAFLMDKDAGGAEAKMAGYYHGVVKRD